MFVIVGHRHWLSRGIDGVAAIGQASAGRLSCHEVMILLVKQEDPANDGFVLMV